MANQEQLDILEQGVEVWNQWRREQHHDIRPDFSGATLYGAYLERADLSYTDLSGANLYRANLGYANLSWADLNGARLSEATLWNATLIRAHISEADMQGADMRGAHLGSADLSGADLREADLSNANLSNADLSEADLRGARLEEATLVGTNLTATLLTDCHIHGISVWNIELEGAIQKNLVITPEKEPTITVDNLEVAQFIYLLLNNPKIRDVIDTVAKKAVLILGRFTPERKAVLDALRDALRTYGYVPILFDFDKPSSRDLSETVSILAHLARFIIADLTEPSSLPKELEAVIPTLAVPVQPILEGSTRPYAMFKDYWKYLWVLEVYRYNGLDELLASLKTHVIEPSERKARELAKLRAQEFEKQ